MRVDENLDESLLGHWQESQRRQQGVRNVLQRSSLPAERFEGWALELIGDAVSERCREADRKPLRAAVTIGVQADDR